MLSERDKPQIKRWINIIHKYYEGKQIIVAMDKLDAISGIKEKMLSYEIFLKENPKWKEKV
jgi:trehalose 6-phosphate synthase/phosphatase